MTCVMYSVEQTSMLGVSTAEDGVTPTASPLDNRLTGNLSNITGNDQISSVGLRRHNSGNSVKRLRLGGNSFHNNANSGKSSLAMLRHTIARGGDDTPPPSPSGTSQGGSSLRIHGNSNRGGSFYGGHQVQVNNQLGRTVGLLRRSNAGKSLARKKRVIQMLGVV